jgi:[ribosomal protein S5]-alanine N-acetyltransferase
MNMQFANCDFETSRLKIWPIGELTGHGIGEPELLGVVPRLLSPAVVSALPPAFQKVDDSDRAMVWLEAMRNESQLLVIQCAASGLVIGFVFLYESEEHFVQLGYLLGQDYWRQGYAKECLQGLLAWCSSAGVTRTIRCGMVKSNIASAKLLSAIGFRRSDANVSGDAWFYEYVFS